METITSPIPKIDLELSEGTKASLLAMCEERGLTPDALVAFWLRTARSPKASRPYSLTDTLRFGRFQGSRLEVVIRAEPDYITWCLTNLENFTMTPPAQALWSALTKSSGYVDLPADALPPPIRPVQERLSLNEGPPQGYEPGGPRSKPSQSWHEDNFPPPPLEEIEITTENFSKWKRAGVPRGTYRIHREIKPGVDKRRLYIKAKSHWVRCARKLEKEVLGV